MQRYRILPKLIIFSTFAKFSQVNMLEGSNREPELLSRQRACAGESQFLLGWHNMDINLAWSVTEGAATPITVPHLSSPPYKSLRFPVPDLRHSYLIGMDLKLYWQYLYVHHSCQPSCRWAHLTENG